MLTRVSGQYCMGNYAAIFPGSNFCGDKRRIGREILHVKEALICVDNLGCSAVYFTQRLSTMVNVVHSACLFVALEPQRAGTCNVKNNNVGHSNVPIHYTGVFHRA